MFFTLQYWGGGAGSEGLTFFFSQLGYKSLKDKDSIFYFFVSTLLLNTKQTLHAIAT